MSEYAQRFAENDIDFRILSDLTDQDLEKTGVASLGRRRKLLRAIASLNDTSGDFTSPGDCICAAGARRCRQVRRFGLCNARPN
jgi:hypothetical protein